MDFFSLSTYFYFYFNNAERNSITAADLADNQGISLLSSPTSPSRSAFESPARLHHTKSKSDNGSCSCCTLISQDEDLPTTLSAPQGLKSTSKVQSRSTLPTSTNYSSTHPKRKNLSFLKTDVEIEGGNHVKSPTSASSSGSSNGLGSAYANAAACPLPKTLYPALDNVSPRKSKAGDW